MDAGLRTEKCKKPSFEALSKFQRNEKVKRVCIETLTLDRILRRTTGVGQTSDRTFLIINLTPSRMWKSFCDNYQTYSYIVVLKILIFDIYKL